MIKSSFQPDPYNFPQCALVVVAAGRGSRFGGLKQLAPLAGKPLLVRTLSAFFGARFAESVVVLPREMIDAGKWESLVGEQPGLEQFRPVRGGETRAESVLKGIHSLEIRCQLAAIHDGARPFPPMKAVAACYEALLSNRSLGAAIVASLVTDTIKEVRGRENLITATHERESLRRAETPQLVRRGLFIEAMQRLGDPLPTDEAQAMEFIGAPSRCILHDGINMKITHPQDLKIAEAVLAAMHEEKSSK